MSATIRAAAKAKLVTRSSLMAYIGNDPNRIIPAGRLTQGNVGSVTLPCLVLEDLGVSGSAHERPFFTDKFNVKVYDSLLAPTGVSYVTIDLILAEVVEALRHTTLDYQASYTNSFEVYFDNYISPDRVDQFVQLPCKYARFAVPSVAYRYELD